MDDLSSTLPAGSASIFSALGSAVVAVLAVSDGLVGVAGAGKHRLAAADQFLKATSFPIKLRAAGDPPEFATTSPACRRTAMPTAPRLRRGGTAYFSGQRESSASVPLQLDPSAQAGRYVATVPAASGPPPGSPTTP